MRNNIIDIKRTESSPTEPCTLAEAKLQAVVTYSDDDTLITALITKARKMIENYCNVSIVAQTVTMIADLYNEWELPYGPVTAITGVQTRTGTEGSGPATYATQTAGWSSDGVEFLSFRPSDMGAFNPSVPYTGNDFRGPGNRYKLIYTTGYSPVPNDLKQAVLVQIVWLYEHRGEEKDEKICEAALVYAEPYLRKLWQ
jgi:uncharacterized phiE125 gp8 family phage protein